MKQEKIVEAGQTIDMVNITNILKSMPSNGAQDLGNGNERNVIYMANTSRFEQTHFSQPLTDYAVGWGQANPQLDASLEHIAPMVVTPDWFDYSVGTNAEYFLSESDDIRAIGADFKRVDPFTATKVNSRTLNKGLTYRVDQDETRGIPDWENRIVSRLMTRLKLNDFRRAVALLKAAATNVAKTWDSTAGKDPDSDALSSIILGNQSIGNPGLTRGIYGTTAWQKRILSLRAQTHAGALAAAMTEAELARLLALDSIIISREIYTSAAPSTLSPVVDTTAGTTGIVLFYLAQSGMSKDDPSNIKRFVSMTEGGTEYKVYRHQVNAKLVDVTVEHYSSIAITSTLGIRMLTIS